jgi:hypothetical protein
MSDDPAHDEEELRKLRDEFKYETDEEIERKRKVFLTHIVEETPEEIAKAKKT